LTEVELLRTREKAGPLLRVAQPVMDRLYQAVGAAGCCVLLAGGDGIPIERRGAAGDDTTFQSWGLWTGAVWSEEHEGTNGIGTCLVEKRPLTIDRDQHFFSRNALLPERRRAKRQSAVQAFVIQNAVAHDEVLGPLWQKRREF